MTKNIKEIGKELLGKSLNSFHRKTGLTQLEKNNKMQDGILNGILSQVDDAYIEKTEQSNVIHLDGSGDGVVVLDSIEGNTMVNIFDKSLLNTSSNMITDGARIDYTSVNHRYGEIQIGLENKDRFKSNTYYTVISVITKNTLQNDEIDTEQGRSQRAFQFITFNYSGHIIESSTQGNYSLDYDYGEVGIKKCRILTKDFNNPSNPINNTLRMTSSYYSKTGGKLEGYILILEGDWLDKDITQYIEGLQSSFEEKVNDEGKYEIEILSKNRTLSHEDYINHVNSFNIDNIKIKKSGNNLMFTDMGSYYENNFDEKRTLKLLPNTRYGLKVISNVDTPSNYIISGGLNKTKVSNNFYEFATDDSGFVAIYPYSTGTNNLINTPFDIIIEPRDKFPADKLKQNKIKFLINEPLRSVNINYKDRLCIKDGRLAIERKCGIDKNLHLRNWRMYTLKDECPDVAGFYTDVRDMKVHDGALVCDKFKCMERDLLSGNITSNEEFLSGTGGITPYFKVSIKRSKLNTLNAEGFKTYLQQNPVTIVYPLLTPVYEEVLNEYGEPIMLEGYENGTIYIDSTIVPTTTVRYTPKMESFKTLKEVENNNIMLTNDVNDNIIPYMMDVDLMIMEKEMALMSLKNIRKMEVLDMTSMQKRTQDMLERLIKGKTLTEQECKTRITTYVHAGKITDEQAEELMLLIDEVYA